MAGVWQALGKVNQPGGTQPVGNPSEGHGGRHQVNTCQEGEKNIASCTGLPLSEAPRARLLASAPRFSPVATDTVFLGICPDRPDCRAVTVRAECGGYWSTGNIPE